MSWRIATEHVSTYHYTDPVIASYNEARMTPAPLAGQTVLDAHLTVRPAAPLFRYVDYWTTIVHAFDVHEPHLELTVTGNSIVETAPPRRSEHAVEWAEVMDPDVQDRFSELLAPTLYAPFDPELEAIARSVTTLASPTDAANAVADWVRSVMRYEPGTTEVSTSAIEAWQQGSGVCQDFAHLTLAMVRQLGLPARYSSGYLHPQVDANIGEAVAGASHAWIEVWLGAWKPIDPTNGEEVCDRHVTVARGRDYADVAPLHGVYHGGALEHLDVSVELTRLS